MTGTCKYCGQEIILPEGTDGQDAWLYCHCPDALRHAQIDCIIEDGRNAIEMLCGEEASGQGLTPIPNNTRFMLLAALPAIANGEIAGIKVKLLGDSDCVAIKLVKGSINVVRTKTSQWQI